MYPRLTHFCLSVENLEECTRFYQRYCQLRLVQKYSVEELDSVVLSEPGESSGLKLRLKNVGQSVIPYDEKQHLGFTVEFKEIVDVLANMARVEGCLFREPGTSISGVYRCGITDPNGNIVEIVFGQDGSLDAQNEDKLTNQGKHQ